MDNKKPIIFRQGDENGIVIERDHFENSIMVNQYQQAVNIFNRLWTRQQVMINKTKTKKREFDDIWVDNSFSNIIAFCGDRGEGKSSCMASFATLLTDNEVRKNAGDSISFPKDLNGNDIFVEPDKIEWLDVIDPSFFDKNHNILELLLGRICEKARNKINREHADYTIESKFRKLMEMVEQVKQSITVMDPKKDRPIYDSVEDVSELAAGMQLKNKLQKLFSCYLDFVDKE